MTDFVGLTWDHPRGRDATLAQAVAYERELQGITFATDDAAEGRAAFAEKRPGVFHRR
ncbi:hypothetical protein [Mycetocola sp. 2940]|uniref:hypothetical protein n=1 Tax=Mycetocola sp. 2940 TaxID=3156452 RepID=UPI003398BFAA